MLPASRGCTDEEVWESHSLFAGGVKKLWVGIKKLEIARCLVIAVATWLVSRGQTHYPNRVGQYRPLSATLTLTLTLSCMDRLAGRVSFPAAFRRLGTRRGANFRGGTPVPPRFRHGLAEHGSGTGDQVRVLADKVRVSTRFGYWPNASVVRHTLRTLSDSCDTSIIVPAGS